MLKKLFIVVGVLFLTGAAAAQQTDDRARAVAEINKHFATVPTMSGEFIQFGPTGEQTGGEFYINRPGKIRFDYEDPSPIMVVSNGKTLGVRNKKLKTWSYFPLRQNAFEPVVVGPHQGDRKSDPLGGCWRRRYPGCYG